jgi:large subunit ribosomal protein L21
MHYAVIEFQGNQYLVKPNDRIVVNGQLTEKDPLLTSLKVLMVKDDQLSLGQPFVEADLSLRVVEQTKSEKIRVFTYKSKSRYRRTLGHRQDQTVLEVIVNGKTESKTAKKPATETTAKKAPAKTTPKTETKKPAKTTAKKVAK